MCSLISVNIIEIEPNRIEGDMNIKIKRAFMMSAVATLTISLNAHAAPMCATVGDDTPGDICHSPTKGCRVKCEGAGRTGDNKPQIKITTIDHQGNEDSQVFTAEDKDGLLACQKTVEKQPCPTGCDYLNVESTGSPGSPLSPPPTKIFQCVKKKKTNADVSNDLFEPIN